MFKCDITHRLSVAVLCMLFKIGCDPMHPLYGALPAPYVPVRVTRGALVAHRYTYAPPCSCTSLFPMTFIPLSSLWNELADNVFDGVRLLDDLKSGANDFLLAKLLIIKIIL